MAGLKGIYRRYHLPTLLGLSTQQVKSCCRDTEYYYNKYTNTIFVKKLQDMIAREKPGFQEIQQPWLTLMSTANPFFLLLSREICYDKKQYKNVSMPLTKIMVVTIAHSLHVVTPSSLSSCLYFSQLVKIYQNMRVFCFL